MISVIVPVFKVEKYIRTCVRSILNQTYKDYELILVDDGSPDGCPQICDQYARNNENIRVIHKENGGLSDARNAGVEIARGEYVTFVDSDDYVAADYLEELHRIIKQSNADIAVTGIKTLKEGDEIKNIDAKQGTVFVYSKEEALEKMLYQDTLDTSACAMLLPIRIAREFPFPVGKYHEDEFTTYKYYSAANKVAVTTKPQYFYVQRENSIMHVFGRSSLDELDAADNLVRYCENNYPQLVSAAEAKKFSDYCQVLLSYDSLRSDYRDVYKRIEGYLCRQKRQMLLDKRARKKNRIAALLLFGGVRTLFWANKIKH